uniref:SAP domain-containing protein n=1 Tax=Knipowitschia caucasica TaxID=637954 RepID=A0AAV2LIX1_KNICA
MALNTEFEKIASNRTVTSAEVLVTEDRLVDELMKQKVSTVRKLCKACNLDSNGSRMNLILRLREEMKSRHTYDKVFQKIWGASGGWSLNYVLDEERSGKELIVQSTKMALTRSDFQTLGLKRDMESTIGNACFEIIEKVAQVKEDMPTLRKWWCLLLMETFDLGSYGKLFAHWTEEAKAMLRGEVQPVLRVKKRKFCATDRPVACYTRTSRPESPKRLSISSKLGKGQPVFIHWKNTVSSCAGLGRR